MLRAVSRAVFKKGDIPPTQFMDHIQEFAETAVCDTDLTDSMNTEQAAGAILATVLKMPPPELEVDSDGEEVEVVDSEESSDESSESP